MRCHECDYIDSKVVESRDLEDSLAIRRRRQCLRCGFRFTTYERLEMPHLTVIKKDGRREPFEREKVAAGMIRACEKRPISISLIQEVVEQIERQLRSGGEAEVPSSTVGELVMQQLATIDDVAYVRFASVYRSFADIESFTSEVAKIKQRPSAAS
jgi:transcriptional repressor NrdR